MCNVLCVAQVNTCDVWQSRWCWCESDGVGYLSVDHCMVTFIKENLLGSVKEFRNRFINPIQNGQCADSTFTDVRVMKKRAHILYEMLAGCVQVTPAVMTLVFLSLYITHNWSERCIYFSFAEEGLHCSHKIPATQTRVCAGGANDAHSVQTLSILPGAFHRWRSLSSVHLLPH